MIAQTFISSLIAATLLATPEAMAQQPIPAATPTEVKIGAVTMEPAALPGNNRQWVKVVATFQTTPRWADGIVFSFTTLLSNGKENRVLQGTVRYANVKAGPNRAVMYISPNTAERFGAPVAATVKAFYKDELADEAALRPPQNVPADWEQKFDKYQGLLATVIQTPWIVYDYANSPDIFATQ